MTGTVAAEVFERCQEIVSMAPRLGPQEAVLEQSRTVVAWLQGLPTEVFERPTVLPDWNVRQLAGHLVLVHAGLAASLQHRTREPPLPIHEFVTRYRRDVEMIMASTLEESAGLTGPEVVARLESSIDDLAAALDGDVQLSRAIMTGRGPTTIEDYLATRIVEVVVHTDDLNRSVPEVAPASLQRGALARCTRTLAGILAARHPGKVGRGAESRRTRPYSARSAIPGRLTLAVPRRTS
jgi:uncharacterized protein (TIGR03083 family)